MHVQNMNVQKNESNVQKLYYNVQREKQSKKCIKIYIKNSYQNMVKGTVVKQPKMPYSYIFY